MGINGPQSAICIDSAGWLRLKAKTKHSGYMGPIVYDLIYI